jgi:TPR repeat protein
MFAGEGSPEGRKDYVKLLLGGDGIPGDLAEAARYLNLSIDQDDGGSNCHLEYNLFGGESVLEDCEAAQYIKSVS